MTAQQAGLLEEEEDTMLGQYLTFLMDQEVYGIEIRYVTEIIGIQEINTLPEVPAYIKGIINLRGKIIPVIDMRIKFKKEAMEYTERTCIVVVDMGDKLAGLIVDSVAEVTKIDDKEISPPPNFGQGTSSRYIGGIAKVDGKVKLLLELETLFSEEEEEVIGRII